jgi:tetratricopeptide (TPR) repeat protein
MVRGEPTPPPAEAPAGDPASLDPLAQATEALAMGDWPAAEDGFRRAAEQNPRSAPAVIGWARTSAFQYRFAEAVVHARRAVELEPRSAAAHAVLAQALNWAGEVDAAAAAARKSIDLDPELADAYAFLAECYVDRYQLTLAWPQVERALALEPSGVEPLRVLGYLLESEARYSEALAAYQAAILSAPRYAHLHFALANVYRALGHADNAVMSYRTAANLAPGDARPLVGLGLLRMAEEDYATAVPYFEQATDLDPAYATAQGQLGTALYLQGNLHPARGPLERAVQLERSPLPLSSYRHALGWVYLRTGALDEAEHELREALVLNPRLDGAREGLRVLRTMRDGRGPA